MNVTEHLQVSEFACHDGTPYPFAQVDHEDPQGRTWLETRLRPLCLTIEVIRAAAGNLPITIDSGFRTVSYDDRLYNASAKNGIVAPAATSQHPKGRAADITHKILKPHEMFNLVLALHAKNFLPFLGGLGVYENFIHVDVRPHTGHLALWGGSRPSNIA